MSNGPETQSAFETQFQTILAEAARPGARLEASRSDMRMMLGEGGSFDFDPHYTYHVAWAANLLKKLNPSRLFDFSSLHYFSVILSAFIPTTFCEYRPVNLLGVEGYSSDFCDLKKLKFETGSLPCISCMHVLEHVGLGRYGDDLDYDGDLQAASEIGRVLAPGGSLLMVLPVGRPRIVFNAHRIYSTRHVREMFSSLKPVSFSLIPDSWRTDGLLTNVPMELGDTQNYACGCWHFIKE